MRVSPHIQRAGEKEGEGEGEQWTARRRRGFVSKDRRPLAGATAVPPQRITPQAPLCRADAVRATAALHLAIPFDFPLCAVRSLARALDCRLMLWLLPRPCPSIFSSRLREPVANLPFICHIPRTLAPCPSTSAHHAPPSCLTSSAAHTLTFSLTPTTRATSARRSWTTPSSVSISQAATVRFVVVRRSMAQRQRRRSQRVLYPTQSGTRP